MSKILTQEELDALLRSAAEIGRSTRKTGIPGADGAMRYNFRRPDRVSKEQIRSLQFLHDRFARNVATSLAAYLRTATEVSLASAEQCTYAEFVRALRDTTAYYALHMTPVDLTAAFELNPVVAFGMIDRMLGGAGHGVSLARALTEIEQSVIDGAIRLVVDAMTRVIGQAGNFEIIVLGIGMNIVLQRARDGLWPVLTRWVPVRSKPRRIDPGVPPLAKRPLPAAGETLLEVKGATKRFGGLVAVNDMNLSVKVGEIVALIGPNGAGKSTVFNLISGVLLPTSGELRFRGRPIAGQSSRQISRLGMSRTFQHVKLLRR